MSRFAVHPFRSFHLTAMLVLACAALSLAGCRSSSVSAASSGAADPAGQSGSAAISGPPELSAFWGTRMPRVCATVTAPPNAAQATALIQCHMDHVTRDSVFLMQNIHIQMDGTHPVGPLDGIEDNIDNRSRVYELSGSHDYYDCAPINEDVMHNTGRNCFVTHSAHTGGECWMVHDGSYHCELQVLAGPDGRAHTDANQPEPTTY